MAEDKLAVTRKLFEQHSFCCKHRFPNISEIRSETDERLGHAYLAVSKNSNGPYYLKVFFRKFPISFLG